MTNKWIDTNEAAEMVGLNPGTLHKWRKRNQGPAYTQAGRRVVYSVNDLVAWMDKNRVEPEQAVA